MEQTAPTPSLQIWSDFKPTGRAAELLRLALRGNARSSQAPARQLIFKDRSARLADADIAFGQPEPADIIASPRIKWVHISSAGYTKFDLPHFWEHVRAKKILVTNSSTVFADACAQHAFAMMMSFARALPWCLTNQFPAASLTADPLWTTDPIRKRSFLLTNQKVILYGYGAIAKRLAELLKPMTANIAGVRRIPRGDESIAIIPTAESDAALRNADHIVNILPLSPATENFFGAERFSRMKPTAHFYNIGRGKTVDQSALIAALSEKRLAAAYLDVTDPEPLPADHLLWKTPNCFITPHSAGGQQNETETLIAHFLANLARYEQNQPLADLLA